MPRGQAWDELPRPYPYAKPIDSISQVLNDAKEGSTAVPQVEMVEKRDMYRDLEQVGRRVLFGSVVSWLGQLFLGWLSLKENEPFTTISLKALTLIMILQFMVYIYSSSAHSS